MTLKRALLIALLTLLCACEDEPPPDFTAFDERVRREHSNVCDNDDDCLVTGCHRSLCRSIEDTRFCGHQIVLKRLDDPSDPDAEVALRQGLQVILRQQLREDEGDSIQLAIGPDSIVLIFHTDFTRRDAVERRLDTLEAGGVYVWHPDAHALSRRALDALPEDSRARFTLRRARGGPELLETRVESNDVADARQRLSVAVGGVLPADARVAFELLPDATPPVLRAWIVEARPRIDFRRLAALTHEPHPHDPKSSIISGRFTPDETPQLDALSHAYHKRPVVWLAGDTVILAPEISAPIIDGHFEIELHTSAAATQALVQSIEQIRVTPDIAHRVVLDREETAARRDRMECYQKTPPLAECGCVDGHCKWKDSTALKQCLTL